MDEMGVLELGFVCHVTILWLDLTLWNCVIIVVSVDAGDLLRAIKLWSEG